MQAAHGDIDYLLESSTSHGFKDGEREDAPDHGDVIQHRLKAVSHSTDMI